MERAIAVTPNPHLRPPTYVLVNWKHCRQISPSSMICQLPITIEQACKVSVDHAFIHNIFMERMDHVAIAIDELAGSLLAGTPSTHRNVAFLLTPQYFWTGTAGGEKGFWVSPKDQWALVGPHRSINQLSITLTDQYFQPLVWDSNQFPINLNEDYDFRLLLKIEQCN